MHPARIAELLEPYLGPPEAGSLRPEVLPRISTYIDLLQRWNARVNLTAIRDEEEIVTRHFGESFFAARHLFPELASERRTTNDSQQNRVNQLEDKGAFPPVQANEHRRTANAATSVADVGSGAGFPGIPLKLWAPEISLTLIESNHKKATFLKELTRALTLTDINIQTARAETLPPSSFDVVTLRAVERFETILPVAARLVAPAGRLALLIGSAQYSIAQAILPSLTWAPLVPIPNSQARVLAVATCPASI